jgi:hypothetical protein
MCLLFSSLKKEEFFSNRISDNKNSSNNLSVNTNNINNINNINSVKPKSSALRALLDEIKSDCSSRSVSRSPPKKIYEPNKAYPLDNSNSTVERNIRQTKVYNDHRNSSVTSNKSRDLNFNDMKCEIGNLQEKIDGLEKRLCNVR